MIAQYMREQEQIFGLRDVVPETAMRSNCHGLFWFSHFLRSSAREMGKAWGRQESCCKRFLVSTLIRATN